MNDSLQSVSKCKDDIDSAARSLSNLHVPSHVSPLNDPTPSADFPIPILPSCPLSLQHPNLSSLFHSEQGRACCPSRHTAYFHVHIHLQYTEQLANCRSHGPTPFRVYLSDTVRTRGDRAARPLCKGDGVCRSNMTYQQQVSTIRELLVQFMMRDE
jgi:hypothetical protein